MAMEGTLLVLGAGGFLGGSLVRCAPARFPGVVGAGRSGELRRFEATVRGSWTALLDELRPRAVINSVALSRVGASAAEPELADALNARFPGDLAAACRGRGVRLVHVSTDLVFGATAPPPGGFDEAASPGPLSVYGRTKELGERAVLAADPSALVVRLPLLCGDSRGTGQGASDPVVADWRAGRRPRLFVDEWRTPLDVGQAAAALVELAELEVSGRLHVAGPRRLSRYELGLAVLRSQGASDPGAAIERASAADFEAPEPRPRDVSLDASRARALLSTELSAPFEGP